MLPGVRTILSRIFLPSYFQRRVREELGRSIHPGGRVVADALHAVHTAAFTAEEKDALRSVEHLRSRLAASRATIPVEDHGAGRRATAGENHVTSREVRAIVRSAASPPRWCQFLFALVRHSRPQRCLELGTSLGISAAAIGSALRLNGTGTLATIEGAPELARLAAEHLQTLGLSAVQVHTDRFINVLPALCSTERPWDLVFIDGHHDEQATISYARTILPFCGKETILLFDDIDWSRGMSRSWRTVSTFEGVHTSVDLGKMGLLLWSGGITKPVSIRLSL